MTSTVMVQDECINQSFFTAMLLSGSPKRAEAAVLCGFQNPAAPREDRLEALLRCALNQNQPNPTFEENQSALQMLPVELKRVLQLTRDLRPYFVLRILMGLPRERCARLLQVKIDQVNRDTCLAISELARLAAAEDFG